MKSAFKPKSDHKRKASTIAPATVTVDECAITVIVPDVIGKNESHKTGRGGRRFTSEQTEMYRASVQAGVDAFRLDAHRRETVRQLNACQEFSTHFVPQVYPVFAQAVSGAWRLEVVGVWPRKREKVAGREVDFLMPCGDADAAIPQSLDALQYAGILDDDARVVEVRAWNLYRRGVRATIMRLVRTSLDLVERDAAIAHLLPLVPPSPTHDPKPAKPRR